jgi:hypothetical protein
MRNSENFEKWKKEYREKNKEKTKEYNRQYRLKNKDKKKKSNKKYYEKNKEMLIRKSSEQNKKPIRKKWKDDNSEHLSNYNKRYKEDNKEKINEQQKDYRNRNKERINEDRRNRMKSNPLYRISTNVRNIVKYSIRRMGYTKRSKTYKILGCSFEEFKLHIESQFEPWMSWDNYGKIEVGKFNVGWDMDHIIPISSATNEDDVIKLNHYTNLQPLCSYTNRYLKKDTIYNSPLEKQSC